MKLILIIVIAILIIWSLILLFDKLFNNKKKNRTSDYNRSSSSDKSKDSATNSQSKRNNKSEKKTKRVSSLSSFQQGVLECSKLLSLEKASLENLLNKNQYNKFMLAKRSGGYRTISAPSKDLLQVQKKIYNDLLIYENVHPACMGFRQNISISNNAQLHLGKSHILKVDLADFFCSIKRPRVIKAYKEMGFSTDLSKILARLCTLDNKLPQGGATSPVLSNIIAYNMDVKLQKLADENNLVYSRYADDLTFSGNTINFEQLLQDINLIVNAELFTIQKKKTRLLSENKRKIITGVSISSGYKLTIPKSKKREVRKNIYFILTKGLNEHQKFIGSNDPSYLKRLMGYLNFWLMVEPDNQYVIESIQKLKNISNKVA